MKHVVSFSTGLSSALVVDRVLRRYGASNVDIVAMDTLAEDEDNWRFARECEQRWGKELIVLTEGRTPRQVAEDRQIIPNQKIAPCTFELKIDLFRRWLHKNYGTGVFVDFRGTQILFAQNPITIHIGYDIFEAHRCDKTKRNYNAEGWEVDFPLLWSPLEHRSYTQVVKDDWGIEPPRTYAMGFTHANCLGDTLCFKTSISDAIKVLINFPENYRTAEDWEQMMRDHPIRKNYAILRDQSNGTVKPLTLKALREKWEAKLNQQPSFFGDLEQQSSACVYCGVGDLGTL